MASPSVEIKLSRLDRVYHPGQVLHGVATIHSRGAPLQHEGIGLVADGAATLQLSAKSVGLFEAFYSSIKPISLLQHQRDLQPPGKLPDGTHDFPFEIELAPVAGEKLHESYHGVFVNLQYVITVEVRRGMLSKNIKRSIEFIVEAPEAKQHKPSPAPFLIVPESLENVRKSALHQVPAFKVRGQLDSVVCPLGTPLTGEVVIEECSATLKSIELQLVRVETCGYQDGVAREATEIQNIQIADGPICHGWPVPIHMVFPRLFTCPTVSNKSFKVEFEVNLVILFSDGHLLTENFPLKLVRGTPQAGGLPGSDAANPGVGSNAAPAAPARPPPSSRKAAVDDAPALLAGSGDDPLGAPLAAATPAVAGGAPPADRAPARPPPAEPEPLPLPLPTPPTAAAAAADDEADPLGGDPLGADPLSR